jgi:phospholipase C
MKGRREQSSSARSLARRPLPGDGRPGTVPCRALIIPIICAVLYAACGVVISPTETPHDLSAVQHIVIIMKENRSFDNYFGTFPGADGATSGKISTGMVIRMGQTPDLTSHDICHTWDCTLEAMDSGKMDKFNLIPGGDVNGDYLAYTQFSERGVPNYFKYARNFVLADHMFASMHGPTFPNRLYAVAGQSGGVISDPKGTNNWGCDAPATATVTVLHSDGTETNEYPCFDFKTLPDELEAAGITWKFYAPSAGDPGYTYSTLDAIKDIRDSSLWSEHVVPSSQFATDAQNGNLPSVSWVVPALRSSEHPLASTCVGEDWTVGQVNAVMQGPLWDSSAIFVTYDESGDFYDHVPPPTVDQFGLGMRVPLLIVSPFAKRGYISHTTYSPGSILKFVEARFNVEPLSDRDGLANDLFDSFDFSQQPLPPLVLQPRQCP